MVEFQGSTTCTAASFTAAGGHCVAGYADGALRLFAADSAALVWACGRHAQRIVSVCCHATKPLVLSASRSVRRGQAGQQHALFTLVRAITAVCEVYWRWACESKNLATRIVTPLRLAGCPYIHARRSWWVP